MNIEGTKIDKIISYLDLGKAFYEEVEFEDVPASRIICFNRDLAEELNLNIPTKSDQIAEIFSGKKLPENWFSIAAVYAGHQFGSFNPRLGDGRAALVAETIAKDNKTYDIQLKGSGPTLYSRGGDGKSPLGPVIREYLMSEAMHALGVPTTRALCALETNEIVHREGPLRGGIFTRVASSHVRIGSFEYFASIQDRKSLEILFSYSVRRHYSEIDPKPAPDNVLEFLRQVAKKQASLVAKWMSLGFIHGVMNTDNMTISGETIDYGPCAFMDHYKKDKVYSYIDKRGRYRYSNQLEIAKWNFLRLCEALLPLIDNDQDKAAQKINDSFVNLFSDYDKTYKIEMNKKLGFDNEASIDQDFEILSEFLEILEENKLDFTNSFKALEVKKERNQLCTSPRYLAWQKIWENKIEPNEENVLKMMQAQNPYLIPRNHVIDRIIRNSYQAKYEDFHRFLGSMKSPYSKPNHPGLTSPPSEDETIKNTFCGT